MDNYYVNTQAQENGDHEVHKPGCSHPPLVQNRRALGSFSNCEDAVAAAKLIYPQSNGCYYCTRACHTT